MIIDNKEVWIFDNEGATADRYTILTSNSGDIYIPAVVILSTQQV